MVAELEAATARTRSGSGSGVSSSWRCIGPVVRRALAAFEHARELLADELGIDPSRELQDLHERVLRQEES